MADRPQDLLIAAEALSLVRRGRVILDGIDLSVRAGEIVTVIGPNGAGKTTLLKAVLGLVPIAAGIIYRRPGLKIGYLPQRLSIDAVLPMTVTRLMRMQSKPRAETIAAALAETGVAHLADAAVQSLSGGEWQRVLIARTLLTNPDLLVLDEPVQGVDFASETRLYELIDAIRVRRGGGVLMVSHDLHLVMAASDRVICLNRHVCCAGSGEAVSRHPEYARLFGPRAAHALAIYTHHHDHRHDAHGRVVGADEAATEKDA